MLVLFRITVVIIIIEENKSERTINEFPYMAASSCCCSPITNVVVHRQEEVIWKLGNSAYIILAQGKDLLAVPVPHLTTVDNI